MDILDNFSLPPGAAEAIKAKGMTPREIDDGVSRFMSGHDKGVAYRFFIAPSYNKIKSQLARYEVFDNIEMIQWFVDRRTQPTEIVKFLPEELLEFDKDGECVGGDYAEAYMAFKEGKAAPGLALSKWGVLSEGEVASLVAAKIFTVEQFAAQDRKKIEGTYPSQFIEAYERANQYVNGKERRETDRATVDKMAELALQNERNETRIRDLQAKLEVLLDSKVQEAAAPKAKKGAKEKNFLEDEE